MGSSPTGQEGLRPQGRAGSTPDCPSKGPTSKDLDRIMSRKPSPLRQIDRTVLNGTEPPLYQAPDHSLTPTNKGGRGQLPGPIADEPDGLSLDSNSALTGFAEFARAAFPKSDIQREEQLSKKYATYATDMSTLLSGGAKTALPDVLESATTEMKDNEPEPTLTQAEMKSIEKRRGRKARAKGPVKNSTACFAFDTPILVLGPEKASWIPICRVGRGKMVVQSLPSGNIEDLTGATMTRVKTACSESGIDIVQMGKARITAHHHIQTSEGWMTARQATEMGHGALLTNRLLPSVFSLCLEGGGNIIINTTAAPQNVPTWIEAATMGCRFEPAIDP